MTDNALVGHWWMFSLFRRHTVSLAQGLALSLHYVYLPCSNFSLTAWRPGGGPIIASLHNMNKGLI